ncbi:MAG: hypothetical protein CMG02_02370 [Candidatus Marinimicrobia bacterium]|nr:hypothetical protein [Candidatus Neomarinimicrobiota bacterium]RPG06001.1 MAG: hypothetical protein CBE07_000220 [Pelagibacteraceae bacterium TMED247]|tara:strand:- start:1638 stop:2636 length:999 start_codon:yes stop_codon:yes gene_type:complete
MIFKSFIIEKNINLLDDCYGVLFYGENIGLKDDFKEIIKKNNKDTEQFSFHQNDVIKNENLLNEQILNTSLFSKKKTIIINDVSEKLKKTVLEILQKPQKDIRIYIFAENLDRKSSIRNYFENEKKLGTVPCYQDNEKTLSIYVRNKLKDYQGLTQELINVLIKNSGTDRKVLSQEIDKMKGLFVNKKIQNEKLMKLINNAYNIDFDNLRDSCLGADKKNLNKNLGNISLQNEKAYFYLSNLSIRIEKLLDLNKLLNEKNSFDNAINSIKPKIFWKDKTTFEQQLKIWDQEKLKVAKKIIFKTEITIKTKMNSLSDVLIKKLLIDLCSLALK